MGSWRTGLLGVNTRVGVAKTGRLTVTTVWTVQAATRKFKEMAAKVPIQLARIPTIAKVVVLTMVAVVV